MFSSSRNSFRPQTSFSTLFSFKDISEKTQNHLTKVYGTLLVSSLICALGMYVNSTIFLSGFFMNLLSIALSIYLICQVHNRLNSEEWRLGCLSALAFQFGFLVGPAIHLIAELEPKILLQALLYTACAFTSFSVISLVSKRRSYLFLGSIIVTLIQGALLYRLMGWLLGY
jgi:hypothetical protein